MTLFSAQDDEMRRTTPAEPIEPADLWLRSPLRIFSAGPAEWPITKYDTIRKSDF